MQQQSDHVPAEAPMIKVASHELTTIGYILLPYAKSVRLTASSSRERAMTLTTLENLRRRIADFSNAGAEGDHFPLTAAELRVIHAALKNFVAHLQQFPRSQKRDDTIGSCEKLRQSLASSFSSSESHGEKYQH